LISLWRLEVLTASQFDGSGRIFERELLKLQRAVEDLIASHKASPSDQDSDSTKDFLTTFLEMHDTNDPLFVRNIMVTLMFGGRDNTQSSLSWSLYVLCRHPKWLTKMRAEAIALNKLGQPTFAKLSVSGAFVTIMAPHQSFSPSAGLCYAFGGFL
jgi:cytochrome P450